MGKKWIVGVMILAALWAMTGCGKQEMIRCEYTNETAGFTLSIDRPVEWTAKLQEGWPATETEEASPDEGIRIYTDDSQESSIYFCNSFSPYYVGDENDLETVEVNVVYQRQDSLRIVGLLQQARAMKKKPASWIDRKSGV